MLNNIKTPYFIALLFSYINERQKLNLIRYNKACQKNMNINILNFKNVSGIYIVHESNGIVKEYKGYNDTLRFEGEYKNGKRNGKGKEYYDGKLIFEGEYLNGIHWKGKGYNENGNIIYELINGTGKVKEYNYNGKLSFEGEYLNGLKNGKGKEYYYNNKCLFEGE